MAHAVLIVTSHDKLGDTGNATGFYWEELASPYYALLDAGHDVTIASIAGGKPPADPNSSKGEDVTEDVRRFWDDETAMKALENSVAIAEVKASDFDLAFIPGGHGAVWDMPNLSLIHI